MTRTSKLGTTWSFMRVRKKSWLLPIIFALVFLSILIFVAEQSAVAGFIYALF
jgi:hypothetical protein